MGYTLSFNQIYDSDISKVGFRAVDLARLYKEKQRVPLSFVVPDLIYEEFIFQNKLSLDLQKIFNSLKEDSASINAAYLEIKNLFRKATLPEEYVDSLKEAYMSLSIESGNPSELLLDKSPVVNLIVSPSYDLNADALDGVFLNIKGFDNFIDALKSAWLFLYSPSQIELRRKKGIRDFSVGVIVQRFVDAESCVEGTSKSFIGTFDITVESYKGLPDILRECSKDKYTLSKEYLAIEHHESALQEYKILKSDKSGLLVKRNLGKAGFEKKLEDSTIIEVCRNIKKASSLFDNYFKAVFVVKKGEIFCFIINRLQGKSSSRNEPYVEKEFIPDTTLSESLNDGFFDVKRVKPDFEERKSVLSAPDSSFFLEIILDLEPQIDSEIFRRYKESFGIYPSDFFGAVKHLNEKHGLSEKEHLYKFKNLKNVAESGGVINLEEFMKLIDILKTFIAGQNGHT